MAVTAEPKVTTLPRGQRRGEGGSRGRLARFATPGRPRRASIWYSRFVGLMKVALPLGAVAILAVLVLWPRLHSTPTDHAPVAAGTTRGGVEMVSPRFFSRDDRGQPFSIEALSAVQSTERAEAVDLERPRAELTMENGQRVTVEASRGLFDQAGNALTLSGGVTVARDDGTEFVTREAHIDVGEGAAWGVTPVHGQGPFGVLRAEGFRIADKGRSVIFTGRTRVVLRQGEELPG